MTDISQLYQAFLQGSLKVTLIEPSLKVPFIKFGEVATFLPKKAAILVFRLLGLFYNFFEVAPYPDLIILWELEVWDDTAFSIHIYILLNPQPM